MNEEIVENIPSKDSGYLFDEEKSSCTNEAIITWDNETWSPIIKNLTNYPTRCTLIFRNFYRVKVYDDHEVLAYEVPLNNTSISFGINEAHTLLNCNNGVNISLKNENVFVDNISNDVSCIYYDDSLEALTYIDNSKNTFLYLNDEDVTDNYVLNDERNLVIDLNGHRVSIINGGNEYFGLRNYGILELKNGTFLGAIYTYNSMDLDSVTVSSNVSTVNPYENSILRIYDSKIYSTSESTSSTIWMHSANLEVYNSYIEGPFAIGGEGGNILVDSSELVGLFNPALQINPGFSGTIQILNASVLKGKQRGILVFDDGGSLTLKSTIDGQSPIIMGETDNGIYLGVGTEFNYESGDIYGINTPKIEGKINLPTGKEMITVNDNGVYHTYLQ